ncbi:hypothetical protein FHT40_002527 [Mycolicibacterium sp. BK556]|uniref:hypothetical protein n=1 Tax=Mycobacteriaceae TaxID=1762 RepID=UPI00105E6D73|nr:MULTISPECIES: hypothetical protein [Mycobacteriaceae]MBB3602866.1 hypothetical protein [Mycolicibacterium sp. BK556]MBB3633061.1 hypothetical protein [Mycolicibacterium sp. BK607]MBB3750608.1 hypothetical protein [Mycolicibacterium sp. BK634]
MRLSRMIPQAALVIALAALPIGVASAEPLQQQCEARGPQQIDILNGRLSCDQAYQVVGGFDFQGEKYQDVLGFTCYTGNAMTLPTVLSCVSPDAEFAVNQLPQ